MKDILVSLLVMQGYEEDKAYWLVEDIFKQIKEPDKEKPRPDETKGTEQNKETPRSAEARRMELNKEKQETVIQSGKMDRDAFVEIIFR